MQINCISLIYPFSKQIQAVYEMVPQSIYDTVPLIYIGLKSPVPKGVTVGTLVHEARKTATYGYTQMRTTNAPKMKKQATIFI